VEAGWDMNNRFIRFLRRVRIRSGATLFEYAIILFLVSIVAVLILQGIGGKTNNMLAPVNNGFEQQ
jgi:Flp pilus assembly pilin Flp